MYHETQYNWKGHVLKCNEMKCTQMALVLIIIHCILSDMKTSNNKKKQIWKWISFKSGYH